MTLTEWIIFAGFLALGYLAFAFTSIGLVGYVVIIVCCIAVFGR